MSKTKPKPNDTIRPKPTPSPFGAISMMTLETLMGEQRFRRLMTFIKHKYQTKRIVLGYHHKGKGAEVYVNGKHIGNIATVERLARKAAKHGEEK